MRKLKVVSALIAACFACVEVAIAQEIERGIIDLHNFNSTNSITEPESTLVEISPGLFVGSYLTGLFQITSAGKFGLLSDFDQSTYDLAASGAITPASNGLLYGVRSSGDGLSAIYRAASSGAGSVILNSSLTNASPLMEGSDGELWGTQGPEGGPFSVFKLSLDGETLTTITEGLAGPTYGPLLQASDGNFYGATSSYTPGGGQIYRVTPSGTLTVLYTFPDGEGSVGGLIEAHNNVLYGTALALGPPACSASDGEIFSISLSGAFQTLHRYATSDCGLLGGPYAGLLEGSDGNLYGTTALLGDTGDNGTIFRIGLDGSGYSDLFTFAGDGENPGTYGPALTEGSDGWLYGTASGGPENGGIVFKVNNFLPPPLPRVGFAQPREAKPGTTIRLTGNYLLGLSAVSFNGTPAAFAAVNVNYAYAVVPSGATSGPITVTTPNGSYTTKSDFIVE